MTHNTAAYKEKLEMEKKTLMEELSGLGVHDMKTNDWEATPVVEEGEKEQSDENDQASRNEGYEERSATLNILEERMREVSDALSRIEKGNYGTCEVCSAPIEDERLAANPAARTCTTHING